MADQVDMRCFVYGVLLDKYVQEIDTMMERAFREQLRMEDDEKLKHRMGMRARSTVDRDIRDVKDTIDTIVRLGCLPGANVLSDVDANLTSVRVAIEHGDINSAFVAARQMWNKLHDVAHRQSTGSGQ